MVSVLWLENNSKITHRCLHIPIVYEPTNLELSVELLDTDMCASWIVSHTVEWLQCMVYPVTLAVE